MFIGLKSFIIREIPSLYRVREKLSARNGQN